jgi:hypothetical protein
MAVVTTNQRAAMPLAFELPQVGNPHKLTVCQHVLPRKSIARFVGAGGKVEVRKQDSKKTFRRHPKNDLFCAGRAWDQRSESHTQAQERAFQGVATRVLNGTRVLSAEEHQEISRFHSLWRLRHEAKFRPPEDVKMKGVLPDEPELTKDQQEILESKHVAFTRGNAQMPARILEGLRIQLGLDRIGEPGLRWGVVESPDLELVVPDTFGALGIVPLSPNCCFVSSHPNGKMTRANAAEVNLRALDAAVEYVFARDFSLCGL